MGDFQSIAEQFVAFYYKTFDENRASLQTLYRDNSMLTFETNAVQGAGPIVEKLVSLPFTKVIHKAATIDAQPASAAGNILVLVTGALQIDDQTSPMNYTQAFQLVPESGSYYVFNDVFRIVYPQ